MKKAFVKAMGVWGVWVLLSPFAMAAGMEYQVHVDGLACPFCAYGIEKSFSKQKGVKEVETDIQAGLVRVVMEEDASLSEEQARKAVKAAGFSLRSFNETGEGN